MPTSSDDFSARSHPVAENISAQRRIWRFERQGWYLLGLLLLLTLFGLFSEGPISQTEATAGDGLKVTYERFERHGAATRMTIAVSQRKPDEIVHVTVNSEIVTRHVFETITPQPLEARSLAGGLDLAVRADRNGNAKIYIALRPAESGVVRGAVHVGDDVARLTQLVYP